MKKLIILGALGAVIWTGCKKEDDERVSIIVPASRPTISFTGLPYYSILVGGDVPQINATAYDSTIGASYPVSITGTDAIDNMTPGLYVIQAGAVNKFGLKGSQNVYVAVTNAADTGSLAGTYIRTANSEPVHITRLARGLYETDDVGGAPTLEVPALFVRLSDTTIDVPEQPTPAGILSCDDEKLVLGPPITISWIVRNGSFGTAVRTFVKQ